MSTRDALGAASTAPLTVRARRRVPGRRAIVGGLLVTVAFLGTITVNSRADDPPHGRVAVVRTPIPVGQRVTADDVRIVPAELPDEAAGRTFDRVEDIEGSIALAPLAPGDLVQRSAVLLPDDLTATGDPAHEFSVPVDRDRAVNGRLEPGEIVDVLATYGTGELAYTVVVARRARLVDVADTAGGLGSDGRVVLTIALASGDDVIAAAHASTVASVTVVRATRAGGETGPDRYPPTSTGPRADR
jgi:Flp pilus assembly protein CpaB